jgi:hypothetical protein
MTKPDSIDFIANDIDELKTTVEEVAEDATGGTKDALGKLARKLEEAKDVADDLEDAKD